MKSTPTVMPINKNPPINTNNIMNMYELIALLNGEGPYIESFELAQYCIIYPHPSRKLRIKSVYMASNILSKL